MPDDAAPTLFSIAMSQARIESKLDTVVSVGQDHETRIRTIESDRDKLVRYEMLEAFDARIRSLEAERDERSFLRNHIPAFATSAAFVSAACALAVLIHSLIH